jgi:hypothetical protein
MMIILIMGVTYPTSLLYFIFKEKVRLVHVSLPLKVSFLLILFDIYCFFLALFCSVLGYSGLFLCWRLNLFILPFGVTSRGASEFSCCPLPLLRRGAVVLALEEAVNGSNFY